MTLTNLKDLVTLYYAEFRAYGTKRADPDEVPKGDQTLYQHINYMLEEIYAMVLFADKRETEGADALSPDQIAKVNRWLGFIQGVLWVIGERTINQLRAEVKHEGNDIPNGD